jgi:hypothetical protein
MPKGGKKLFFFTVRFILDIGPLLINPSKLIPTTIDLQEQQLKRKFVLRMSQIESQQFSYAPNVSIGRRQGEIF